VETKLKSGSFEALIGCLHFWFKSYDQKAINLVKLHQTQVEMKGIRSISTYSLVILL